MRAPSWSVSLCAVFVVLSSACGSTTRCSPTNCTGCCDASGACQTGSTNAACGVSGAQCTACLAGQTCSFGFCSGLGGGGSGTTGGGGGTTGGGGGTTGGGGGTTGGGGGTTGGGGGANASVTQYCIDVVGVQLGLWERCGMYSAAGVAAFRAELEDSCRRGALFPSYTAGRVQFDPVAAEACLTAQRSATCTQPSPGERSCSAAFVGAVGLDGTCYHSTDCTSALYCNISLTCPGRCATRKAIGQPVATGEECVRTAEPYGGVCTALVPVGQSCAPTGGQLARRSCVEGATCSAADQCVASSSVLRNVGESCNEDDRCGVGMNCIAGTCVRLGVVGAACDSARVCQYDLRCNAANVCERRGAAGASCASISDCDQGLFCNRTSSASTGTCAVLRTTGQTCTGYSQCASGLICTFSGSTPGVCRAPLSIGAACVYNGDLQQCGEGYCTATSTTSGVCANKKGAGATCTRTDECHGFCSDGLCTAPSYCSPAVP